MNEWKATGGRLTLLSAVPMPSDRPSALDLYRRLWGGEPEGFQRPSNPLMPSVAQGTGENLKLVCIVQPGRIDFVISPSTPFQDPAQAQFPVVQDASELHTQLLHVMDEVGRNLVPNSIVRVAASIQFINVQPTFADANKALTSVIPASYGVKVTDEEDFVFQVNRPRTSRTENIRMNEVIKWSVDRLKIVTAAIPTQGTPTAAPSVPAPTQTLTSDFIAASVTFDNNNTPSEQPLPPAHQSALLGEAFALALQMQQKLGLRVEGFRNASVSR